MQVLQLSDEQIAALPPEQRQSILVLKEQIAKSSQRWLQLYFHYVAPSKQKIKTS